MRRALLAQLLVASALLPARAVAQPSDPAPAAASPAEAQQPEIALDVEREIDIANIVTSAAKGVTTVQEAPSIITIITAEEIKQRGHRTLGQVLASIPGWLDVAAEGNQVSLPMVRGNAQAALYLRDGVSFFDPVLNVATMSRAVPLETIKRIEVVTGPGGVLWGANSFLGIVNVITKDAEDVGGHGVEIGVGGGHGPGSPSDFRAYTMFGRSFWKNRVKVFLHASFETFVAPEFSVYPIYAASPAPQPLGPSFTGVERVLTGPARSWILNLDGKLSVGPVSLYFNLPFGEINPSLSFSATPVVADPGGRNRNAWNFYDRYAVLEYKSRFLRDRIGFNAKAYYIQFNRELGFRLFPESNILPKGFTVRTPDQLVQRFGGTVDSDLAGPWSWNRVLVGAEAFHERSSTSHINIPYPESPADLPLVCPVDGNGAPKPGCPLVFAGATERTVIGVFLADQIRPLPVLTFDGGIRYQQAFGKRAYDAQFLGSASAVWQFYTDMHLKLNFAQGFRAPVFNNTDSNGAAVQFGGNPDLRVERSDSFQGEINFRVLRNQRRIRELQLRVDYSYTVLNDFITILNSKYTNSGKRAFHSVEALSKLYLDGDHTLWLGYTFLQGSSTDLGSIRNVPNHWLSLGATFNAITNHLDFNGNLHLIGGYEDPNRYETSQSTISGQSVHVARFSDVTIDRLPPVALLQLGVRGRFFRDHFDASVQVYNVLNQRYYYPDTFFDQAPTIEVRPNPGPAFSFFATLTYRP